MREPRKQKTVPPPERQSSRIRGIPATSPTVEAVVASNRSASSSSTTEAETEQALPGAAPAVLLPAPEPGLSADLLQVQPQVEVDTAKTQYFDSYLEGLLDTELSYSELAPESDTSFTSVPESEAILEAAEATLILNSSVIMTGPSFATIQQRYATAYTTCENHAKKPRRRSKSWTRISSATVTR